MKIGTLLLILHDVIDKLVEMKLLTEAGDFFGPNLQQDLNIVQMVEQCVKARGITVQADVDKIINTLPLVIALFGK